MRQVLYIDALISLPRPVGQLFMTYTYIRHTYDVFLGHKTNVYIKLFQPIRDQQ